MTTATLILGGGCFWCLDAVFRQVPGVIECQSGYAGGARPNPNYEQICTGATGHAEVVRLHYDPDIVSMQQLLDIFFVIHDPTTQNRQGHDVGTQYRSVIYCVDDPQRADVTAYVDALRASGRFTAPIVTEVAPAPVFWPAEDYHQDYFRKNPGQGYCMAVVAPKVRKLQDYLGQRG